VYPLLTTCLAGLRIEVALQLSSSSYFLKTHRTYNAAVCDYTRYLVLLQQSHYRPEVPRGFQEVKVPTLRDNGPGWW
jgi:hypothetical protein